MTSGHRIYVDEQLSNEDIQKWLGEIDAIMMKRIEENFELMLNSHQCSATYFPVKQPVWRSPLDIKNMC